MAAKNLEPTGSRPGPKAPNTHGPIQGDKPFSGKAKPIKALVGEKAPVAEHGTPKPVGANKRNPLH